MNSNDLLSYSILHNGKNAVTHTPHFTPIRPISPSPVSLPPLAGLTEANLSHTASSHFTFSRTLSGLNSYDFLHSHYRLSSELSQGSSPRLESSLEPCGSLHASGSLQVSGSLSPQLSAECSPEKKRRQRLGPSCDSCRARKVKCNADVVLLSRNVDDEEPEEVDSLLPEQKKKLFDGALVAISGNFNLVVSNGKLVKFKPCSSCATRELECCFSKGFTKEDIVHSKRCTGLGGVGLGSSAAAGAKEALKKVKKRLEAVSARKSSCVACRRRKVKCVMNSRLGKCVGCVKKELECSFA